MGQGIPRDFRVGTPYPAWQALEQTMNQGEK